MGKLSCFNAATVTVLLQNGFVAKQVWWNQLMRSFLECFETQINGSWEYNNCIIVNDGKLIGNFPLLILVFSKIGTGGMDFHITFYVSVLWPSFMKTDWFLKYSGKILKLSAREKQEQVAMLLCNWAWRSLCGKSDGLKLEKKNCK